MKTLEYFFPLIYGVEEAKYELQSVCKICEEIFAQYELRVVSQESDVDIPTSCQNATSGGDVEL